MHIIYQGDLLKNILIVFGGNSFEHEVSIKSASNIYNFIDKSLFNVNSLYICKEGIWYEFNNDFKNINIKNLRKIYNIIEYLKRYDLVFNIIHGYSGEDGKLQSLFELFELKYINSTDISAGDTPDMRLAWPTVIGFMAVRFCLASSLRPPMEL